MAKSEPEDLHHCITREGLMLVCSLHPHENPPLLATLSPTNLSLDYEADLWVPVCVRNHCSITTKCVFEKSLKKETKRNVHTCMTCWEGGRREEWDFYPVLFLKNLFLSPPRLVLLPFLSASSAVSPQPQQ